MVEATQAHVVLRRVEAAEPEVGPELGVVDAHLQQSAVVPQRDLGLVGVEVLAGEARDGFDVGRVEEEDLKGEAR